MITEPEAVFRCQKNLRNIITEGYMSGQAKSEIIMMMAAHSDDNRCTGSLHILSDFVRKIPTKTHRSEMLLADVLTEIDRRMNSLKKPIFN